MGGVIGGIGRDRSLAESRDCFVILVSFQCLLFPAASKSYADWASSAAKSSSGIFFRF